MRARERSGRWFVCLSEMGGDRKAVGRGSCGGGAAPVVCAMVRATGAAEVRAGMCPSPVAGVRCGGRRDGGTEAARRVRIKKPDESSDSGEPPFRPAAVAAP